MAKVRAFLGEGCEIDDGVCLLGERESHHLGRVLRIGPRDHVELLDGCGTVRMGELAGDRKARRLSIRITGSRVYERAPGGVSLLLGLPKQKALDGILRGATEIGARRIQIVFTEHSEVKWEPRVLAAKRDKARQTLVEACKQCGLPFLPELPMPQSLNEWAAGAANGGWVGALRGEPPRLREALSARPPRRDAENWFAVGPEGDFCDAEYDLLERAHFQPVALGAFTLRTETAAIYGMSVIDQFL